MIHLTQGRPGSGMTYPRTPPVENSEPSGATDGKDGQGVCAPRLYMLTYQENSGPTAGTVTTECDMWPVNAAIVLRSLLGRGIESVTVEVQL